MWDAKVVVIGWLGYFNVKEKINEQKFEIDERVKLKI